MCLVEFSVAAKQKGWAHSIFQWRVPKLNLEVAMQRYFGGLATLIGGVLVSTVLSAGEFVGIVSGADRIPRYKQTDFHDTNLYDSISWATAHEWSIELGEMVPRYTLTCLAVVYAMLAHARGQTDYRVGQDGTWGEDGAIDTLAEVKNSNVGATKQNVLAEFAEDRPVILQGYSDSSQTV